ncbi:MAG: DNA polymerase III subunit gamma/tau [Betaproteobacteria bacterium]|nr:DNA polymerase III subunit gamma/tau [Betaproteobacteria bacterium]
MDPLFPEDAVSQHQVLARKWRPRNFASLVGQEHVVKALRHGLKTGRIHHAYLLTGTRGVGKTTIARILAKALNCEQVDRDDPDPCGLCSSCLQIDRSRYVDYLELDAASHRGVEEMAQLLENAIYAPTLGRWKVYVIDEVHMLSNHAFNAMLKTLEEPPGHVVFVLATTDPQKVPVTVLSRCLQLSLRNMSPQAIAEHLSTVLHEEQIAYESDALNQIAKSAAGSMRDALSLLDQAISHGAGEVRSAEVLAMLGAIDRDKVAQIMEALLDANPRQLCALAEEVCALGVDAAAVLQALAQLVQDLSLLKLDALESDDPQLRRWADACEAEQLQVYWQILLHGRRDLSLAPDQQAGLTMTLLRLHAFRPLAFRASATQAQAVNHGSTLAPDVRPVAAPAKRAAQPIASSMQREASEPQSARQPLVRQPLARQPLARQPSGQDATVEVTEFTMDCEWSELATRIPCSGFVRQFLEQSELLAIEGVHIRVRVPIRPLAEQATVNKVKDLLVGHFQVPLRLSAEVGSVGVQTAASIHDAQRRAERDAALQGLQSDPFVQAMVNELGAQIDPDSVQARKH